MALILPPAVPAIVENVSAQFFGADHICLKVRRDTVWCQFVTKHCLGGGHFEYVPHAICILTPWAFSDALADMNFEAVKAGLTISGRAKLILN